MLALLAAILAPTVIALLALIAWVGFDIGVIVANIGLPQIALQVDAIKSQTIRGLGAASGILQAQPISPLLMALLLISAAFVWWRGGRRAWVDHLPLAFALGFLGAEQLAFLASWETPAIHSFAYAVVFLALLHSAPDRDQPLLRAMSMSLVAVLLVFAVSYDWFVHRKSWSETNFAFGEVSPANSVTALPFFQGVRLQHEHAVFSDELASLKSRYPDARIMYSQGLEAFFPATRDTPPRGWPNWFHPGLSYRVDDVPRLRAIFERERYDYVLVVDQRIVRGHEILTPSLNRLYFACQKMAGWVTLFCRKDRARSEPGQNREPARSSAEHAIR